MVNIFSEPIIHIFPFSGKIIVENKSGYYVVVSETEMEPINISVDDANAAKSAEYTRIAEMNEKKRLFVDHSSKHLYA